jgi:hypothetical protein
LDPDPDPHPWAKYLGVLELLNGLGSGSASLGKIPWSPRAAEWAWIRIRIIGQNTLESSSCWMGSWERDLQSQILTSVSTEPLITTVDSSLNLTQFTEASMIKQTVVTFRRAKRNRFRNLCLDFTFWLHCADL